MLFEKWKFEKLLKELSFHYVCILLLFIYEGIDKKYKNKKKCLKGISFLSPTNIWVWKSVQSRENKIRSLVLMQSNIFDQFCSGTLHKTSS